MHNIVEIKKRIENSLREFFGPAEDGARTETVLGVAPSHTGADFTSYLAFTLAKEVRGYEDPKGYAEAYRLEMEKRKSLQDIVEIKIAGNGFINFFLHKNVLLDEIKEIQGRGDKYGSSNLGSGKTVVIDYSGPNVAKRFSVGHLRSTVIGQALYNLYKFLGYNVIGENHLGDWGTQFGMLIAQITRKNLDARKLNVEDLEQLYVGFNQEMEVDPGLREQAKFWFKKLEEGDEVARNIWQEVRKISLQEFEKIYDLLDVHIDNAHGESFYEDKMQPVLEELEQNHLIKDSEGARVVEVGANMPPAILIKSDGTTTYLLRDLAAVNYRLRTWNPELLIYEVGSDQMLHLRQLFAVVELLGWSDGKTFEHVAHGLIRFQEGKMSTRQGKIVNLEEVLDEAIKRARVIIEKSETERGLSENEKEKVARAVGIGAIKYFDLSHNPGSDIMFDWGKLFMLEGNSAPYLQYTHARIQSVLAKAARTRKLKNDERLDEAEARVARILIHFPEVLCASALQYAPNLLCNFLFELAQHYNNFYANNRIIESRRQALRLIISQAVGLMLSRGLSLLGIQTLERM